MADNASDILFLFPPAHGNPGAFKNHLGVSYLRAALARDGIATSFYTNDLPTTIAGVAADIIKCKPHIVGFTVYDANFSVSLALAKQIKQRDTNVTIVFGGPSATFGAAHILPLHSVIDLCVLGEAEECGARIFSALLSGKKLSEDIDGIAFMSDGRVISTNLPPLVGCGGQPNACSLDSTPSPYLSGILPQGRPGVLSGRGCTHHCQYCCFAALGRKKLRLHSIDRVVAELEFIADHQKSSGESYVVAIHDDAFTLVPDRAKKLCSAIIEKKIQLALSCITRADALDDELLRLMREAGFISLAFGLESAVPRVLRATGKVKPPNWPDESLEPEIKFIHQVENSVKTARKYNFNVGVSIILGLPDEKAEDGRVTLDFVKRLPIHYYMHNYLWLFPGTPLWETASQYGIDCEINSLGLPTMTKYAYDVSGLRPVPKCALEQDAQQIRLNAVDGLFSCGSTEQTGGIHTVVLRSSILTEEMAAWFAATIAIGATIIQIYPKMSARRRNDALYRDRAVIGEFLVPARHHIQLLPSAEKSPVQRWMVHCAGIDMYRTFKPRLVSIAASDDEKPFLHWLADQRSDCDYCDVSSYLSNPVEI
ncbi:MAG: B12-binding domain-containing radical SAM protein, partial [Chitinivibrionales bacterium]|nr:B12-binding domain-containing radical SAM protein [Chitinivibrionales bacterium]